MNISNFLVGRESGTALLLLFLLLSSFAIIVVIGAGCGSPAFKLDALRPILIFDLLFFFGSFV